MTTKKITALTLVLAELAAMLACGDSETADTDETKTNDSVAAEETSAVDRADTPDSLPDALDFDQTVINVLFPESHGGSADQIDWVSEDDGEVVSSAIYQRTTAVEERLGVEFDVNYDYTVTEWPNILRSSIMAQDGSFDLVWGAQYETVPLAAEGMYLDLSDAEYIDYSQPWWNNEFMEEISVGDVRYLLAGDISLSMLSYMSCVYFGKERFEEISGETSDDLYQLVLDGGWTIDKLAEYCRLSYSDLNGDSARDEDDRYGMGAVTASTTDHLTFDSGITFTTRDANGLPMLTIDNERTYQFVEKLYSLFYENEGVFVYPPVQDSLRIVIPNKFTGGDMTFMCGYFYSADLLREMKSDYGIIPYPKLDENVQDYASLVHDSAMLVSVPITCTKLDAVTAAIEAIAAENWRTVTPAYYEIALKTKYTRDDTSCVIVDMIHESGTTDFAYAYNRQLGGVGQIMRKLAEQKSSDFASAYAQIKTSAEAGLVELIESFGKSGS